MGVRTMPLSRENLSEKQPNRPEALQARHAELERQIHTELKHPGTSEALIRQLKRRKLRVKEEIEEARTFGMARH